MPRAKLSDDFIENLPASARQVEWYDTDFASSGSFGIRSGAGNKRSYFYIYSRHGQRKRMTLGSFPQLSIGEARARAALLAEEVSEGKDPAALQNHFGLSYIFNDLCRSFLQEHVEKRCSEKTAKEYRRLIQKDLLAIWGDRDARSITTNDVQQALSLIAKQRGAGVLSNRIRSLLNRVFRFGIEKGLLSSNPVKNTREQQLPPPRHEILERDEVSRLWSASLGVADPQSDAFRFLLLTGQNLSDLRKLKWADIRLEQWYIEKGKTTRAVHLTPPALDLLRQQREQSLHSEHVFDPRTYYDIRRFAKSLARLANIREDFSLSWIRRTMLYRLPAEGASHPATDFILGRMTSLKAHRIEIRRVEKEAKRAMTLWTRLVIPNKPGKKPPAGNVIPLFGD